MKFAFKSLVVAGLLAGAGFTAMAQNAAPIGETHAWMGDSSMMGHGDKGAYRHMTAAKMEAMVVKRNAALKAKLNITAQQEGAWTTFTTAMKPPTAAPFKPIDRAALDQLTTPQRIDKMHSLRTQRMADMNAAMDRRDEATKTFYAALSSEQQKIFDSEHARRDTRHARNHSPRKAKSAQPAKPNPPVKQ